MLESDLKRKLRSLKKLEAKIRYFAAVETASRPAFIWDDYFSLEAADCSSPAPARVAGPHSRKAKYSLTRLQQLGRAERKSIIEQYIYEVFIKSFQEGKMTNGSFFYDTQVLALLGLPWDSSAETIKTRFRQLAKLCHPDQGGETEKMIQLLELYEKIFPKNFF